MSVNKKKHLNAMEEDPSDTSTDSSSSDEDDGPDLDTCTSNEEVEVEFEGRSPIDPDCHGISQLLQRLFLRAQINCMKMADLIIAQNFVGSVICQCEPDGPESDTDDDMCEDGIIFGITTVLNLTAKKDEPCVQELRTYIVERAEKYATDSVLKHIRDILSNETEHVGFLINERFINIPAQISVPLLDCLRKEIQAAKAKNMKFDFVYYLMIVKFYRKNAKKGKPAEDTFTNAEEELICEHAINSFEFSVAGKTDNDESGDWVEGDPTLAPYRKVLLFDAKQLPQLIQDVQKLFKGQ